MRTLIFLAGSIAYLVVGWLIGSLGHLFGWMFLVGIGFVMLIYPIMFGWLPWLVCLVVTLVWDLVFYTTRDRG